MDLAAADLDRFVARLRSEPNLGLTDGRPAWLSRAPGRLDVLGGVIDYSGGTVVEMPGAQATCLALQPRDDRRLRVTSLDLLGPGQHGTVELELDAVAQSDEAAVGAALRADARAAWAAYVAGAWTVLTATGAVTHWPHGAEVVLSSEVPSGAGVSSSAALEMATLSALDAERELHLEPLALAHLGQRLENRVVGAPCGLMDQLTVTLGRADSLLVIRCQPDQIVANRALPPGVCIGAIHTGVKHSVGGSHYTSARVASFMAHRIILEHLRNLGTVPAEADPFGGYLAQVPPDEFARAYLPLLPERIGGAEFLARWGETVDPVTRLDPAASYRPAAAARHHLRENQNTYAFLAALEAWQRTRQPEFLATAGELMLAGHAGYRDDLDLGAGEADTMIDLALGDQSTGAIYGARITGGGSGGSVCFLGDERLPERLPIIAERYRFATGCQPTVLLGSSDGAAAVGVRQLAW